MPRGSPQFGLSSASKRTCAATGPAEVTLGLDWQYDSLESHTFMNQLPGGAT